MSHNKWLKILLFGIRTQFGTNVHFVPGLFKNTGIGFPSFLTTQYYCIIRINLQ